MMSSQSSAGRNEYYSALHIFLPPNHRWDMSKTSPPLLQPPLSPCGRGLKLPAPYEQPTYERQHFQEVPRKPTILRDAASRPDRSRRSRQGAIPEALNARRAGTELIAWLLWHAGRQMDAAFCSEWSAAGLGDSGFQGAFQPGQARRHHGLQPHRRPGTLHRG